MLFNSIDFFIFLPIVFILYWFVFKNQLSKQNILILISSYFFYGWWDYRFLGLIFISTLVDYCIGNLLGKTTSNSKRKFYLYTSLIVNLGMLCYFKYFNFFIESWVYAWSNVGVQMNINSLNVILPVGISFYTFQTLSYTIDVYNKKINPTKNFIDFASFVTFFPQLVAGPIERASHLLPQFYKLRVFNYGEAVLGLKLIIFGLFKKVVVADNCAFFVNSIFENPASYSTLELFMGMVFFAFQIYGDFSGYSDIAIGISKLFGFDLMTNFKFPYFSRDIAEFWRRWHISLSTWFRDYLYIPLGGSKVKKIFQIRNTLIVFIVSGFWHGANWTYIFWGLYHALLFIPLLLTGKNLKNKITNNYIFIDFFKIIFTFLLVCIGWVFFRANSIDDAIIYIQNMLSFNSLDFKYFIKNNSFTLIFITSIISIFLLCFIELFSIFRTKETVYLSKFMTIILILMILIMGSFKNQMDFIYFQF